MDPRKLALLEKLAAMKAQKSLRALTDLRAARQAEEEAEARAWGQTRAGFDAPVESGEGLRLWGLYRAGAQDRALAARGRAAALGAQEDEARARAARDKGREEALGMLAEQARDARRREAQKRAERATDALNILKRPKL